MVGVFSSNFIRYAYILSQMPSADVAITHDDVWRSILQQVHHILFAKLRDLLKVFFSFQKDVDFPSNEDMLGRVLQQYRLKVDRGSHFMVSSI
jgi:hypothetical protein